MRSSSRACRIQESASWGENCTTHNIASGFGVGFRF
jgi:hypothetical protein